MAAKFTVKKKPPKPEVQFAKIRAGLVKEFSALGQRHVKERQRIVSDFDNQPQFSHEVKQTPSNVTMNVLLTNPSQDLTKGSANIRNLYGWLFETGTRPHEIRPRGDRPLAFRAGRYDRKRRIDGSKGTGRVSRGQWVSTKKPINHPGFEPSLAVSFVNVKLAKPLGKILKNYLIKAQKLAIRNVGR